MRELIASPEMKIVVKIDKGSRNPATMPAEIDIPSYPQILAFSERRSEVRTQPKMIEKARGESNNTTI